MIFIAFGFCIAMQNEYELWKKAEMLNHQKNKDEALELYLALFQKNKTNNIICGIYAVTSNFFQ